MANALVDLGTARATVGRLSQSEQLFLARWLQLLHDETHPRWSVRPLSRANLSSLYQRNLILRNKQVLLLTEDELLRRIAVSEPDMDDANHPTAKPKTDAELLYCVTCGSGSAHPLLCSCSAHPQVIHCMTCGTALTKRKVAHSAEYEERSQCARCRHILLKSKISTQERLFDLVERLIVAINEDDEKQVLALTPSIASEAIAARVSPRFMLQTCRRYVLHGKGAGSFSDRLYDFLRHDVAIQTRPIPAPSPTKCSVSRKFDSDPLRLPGLPIRLGNNQLGVVTNERGHPSAQRTLQLIRTDVDDLLSKREIVAAELRGQTPGWLALLRFCFPHHRISAKAGFEISTATKTLECPGHRRILSHREIGRAVQALELLICNDEVRASLYWLSLAYQVWGESITHASSMVWMGIESLVGNKGLRFCAEVYVSRLQSQLADDIEETLGALARSAADRKEGWAIPSWLTKLPRRYTTGSDSAWLAELDRVGRRVCDDPGVRFVLKDAAGLASDVVRDQTCKQTLIDLRLLRANRHAIAHTGKSTAEEPLLHYLATVGCECLRALLAQRLDGTASEGTLDGYPILHAHCQSVSGHIHLFYVSDWITEDACPIYTSTFVKTGKIVGHRHQLVLTTDDRRSLAKGETVEVVSSMDLGHCHVVRLHKQGLPCGT